MITVLLDSYISCMEIFLDYIDGKITSPVCLQTSSQTELLRVEEISGWKFMQLFDYVIFKNTRTGLKYWDFCKAKFLDIDINELRSIVEDYKQMDEIMFMLSHRGTPLLSHFDWNDNYSLEVNRNDIELVSYMEEFKELIYK